MGSVSLTRGVNIHRLTAELGYYVGEPYWGRGLATGAVRAACEYVFGHSDIVRIFAEPFAANAASRRVLEKSGFRLEGVLRANAFKNGAVLDMCMYSLLRPVRALSRRHIRFPKVMPLRFTIRPRLCSRRRGALGDIRPLHAHSPHL